MTGEGTEPTYVINDRDELTPVFENLRQYQATMHFNGQQTVTLAGNTATGESYTIAHHLTTDGDQRQVMVAYLRYHDSFTKVDGTWLFAARDLIVDWTETRPSPA